jgi:hypothetical protein
VIVAKAKSTVQEPDVVSGGLQAVETDLSFALATGKVVVDFLKRAALFFQRGDELEVAGQEALGKAKTLAVPENKAHQESLQAFIRSTNAAGKQTTEHWAQIASPLHQLHKRVVARRERALGYFNEAVNVGNRLHNQYVEAEQRRAREEQARQQREADERAKAERDRELGKLEEEAQAREAASDDLSERERTFVRLFVLTGNAAKSATAAGFKLSASTLLAKPKIQQAVEALRAADAIRHQAAAIAAAPVESEAVEVQADVVGHGDRTTWKADVFDREALIAAVFAGQVPRDVLTIDEVRLNGYARELKTLLRRWPGVRAVSTTKVV